VQPIASPHLNSGTAISANILACAAQAKNGVMLTVGGKGSNIDVHSLSSVHRLDPSAFSGVGACQEQPAKGIPKLQEKNYTLKDYHVNNTSSISKGK